MSRGGILYGEKARERNAPARRSVLELNAELRKDRRTFAAPDGDSGHMAFFIPEEDFYRHAFGEILHIDAAGLAYIRRGKYPALVSADPHEQVKEMRRLLADHPEYRINPREGKRVSGDARTEHRIIVK